MSLTPDYNLQKFESIDLRRYHIRDMKDVVSFIKFTTSRLQEMEFVLKKLNNQVSLYGALSKQLSDLRAKTQQAYGNPNAEAPKATSPEQPQIQAVDTVKQDQKALLEELKQAQADEARAVALEKGEVEDTPETYAPADGEPELKENGVVVYRATTPEGRDRAIYEKWLAIKGLYRIQFRRSNKLMKNVDVPSDIREMLTEALGGEPEPTSSTAIVSKMKREGQLDGESESGE